MREARAHAGFREEPPSFSRDAYPAGVIARAVQGWRRLHLDERDSLLAASLVLADLARLGAPSALLAAASRVVEDEARHVRVCGQVLAALDREPPPEEARVEREPPPGSLAERQAFLLIAGFVVGESMSAASFAVSRERGTEPLIHWAYTELLRDESRHGAFGADAAEWVLTLLPPGYASKLWPNCVMEMGAMETRVGGPYDEQRMARELAIPDLAALEKLGLTRGSETCRSYQRAIEQWVIPRLSRLGVTPAREG